MTDLFIGGAGLAGLRIGLAVLQADPSKRVILLEKEKHTVETFRPHTPLHRS